MQIERVTYETLEEIKDFYRTVVQKMCDEEIFLWDEIYPIEFLQKDIESNELFCLRNNHEILAAFTLCKTGDGAEAIEWSPERDGENIFYLYRFAVNAHHKRTGLGSVALKHIFATAQIACEGQRQCASLLRHKTSPHSAFTKSKELHNALGSMSKKLMKTSHCENMVLKKT